MSGTDDLDSRFAIDAAFTLPVDPPTLIAGTLRKDSDGIVFERSAYLAGFERLMPADVPQYAALHGVTFDGNCTLFDVFEVPGTRMPIADGRVFTTAKYVANGCVMGLHIGGVDTKEIDCASFTYSGLGEWFRPGVLREFTADWATVTVNHPLGSTRVFERSSSKIEAMVRLEITFPSKHTPEHYSVSAVPLIEVKPDHPRSIRWFMDVAARIENFLSLMMGASTHLKTMRLLVGRELGSFVHQRRGTPGKVATDVCVKCTFDEIGDALLRWVDLPSGFEPIENLIYGTIRNSSLFAETEFLSLAQALESFHRITSGRTLLPQDEFSEVRRVLGALIDFFFCTEPAIRHRLRESIYYANEPNFRSRISELIGRLKADHAEALLGNVQTFGSNLVDTRNYFTHPGISRKPAVLRIGARITLHLRGRRCSSIWARLCVV